VSCLGEVYGNASSIHHFGQQARQRLETARRRVAQAIGCTEREIVFTSGGTEADNLALLGVVGPGGHVVTTAIEHPAVLSTCAEIEKRGATVTRVAVGADCVVDPDAVRRALRPNTQLISVMHANNETGALQPLAEIGGVARQAGVPLHADGVQALGKLPVNVRELGVDLYSVAAHKIHGPKGIGALYVRRGMRLAPVLFGGHHERERRPGTENVPGAVGFAAALDLDPQPERLAALRDRLESAVLERIPGVHINAGSTPRTPNTTNLRFDGISGEALVIALDLRGFAASSGSACSSGAVEPSHVLTAMGLTPDEARASIRISLGHGNTEEQVDALVEAMIDSVTHLRRISNGIGT